MGSDSKRKPKEAVLSACLDDDNEEDQENNEEKRKTSNDVKLWHKVTLMRGSRKKLTYPCKKLLRFRWHSLERQLKLQVINPVLAFY